MIAMPSAESSEPSSPDARIDEPAASPAGKRALRKQLRARRNDLVAGRDADADAEALAREGLALLSGRGLGPGSTTMLYASWEGEPPTRRLLEALQENGIRVLLPITLADLDLDWHDAADPIHTPLGKDAVATADLALVPGLTADRTGTRMGQGGGCYDRAIPRLREGTEVVVLLHPGELQPEGEELPRDAHDAPVDGVLTADGFTALPR